jgi:hypothetical protein
MTDANTPRTTREEYAEAMESIYQLERITEMMRECADATALPFTEERLAIIRGIAARNFLNDIYRARAEIVISKLDTAELEIMETTMRIVREYAVQAKRLQLL